MLNREARFLLPIYVFISHKIKHKRNIFGYEIRNMTITLKTKSKTYKLINTFFASKTEIFLLKVHRCNQKNRKQQGTTTKHDTNRTLLLTKKMIAPPLVAQKNNPTYRPKNNPVPRHSTKNRP